MNLSCPRCGSAVLTAPEREWKFHQYRVSRFRCECGDKFNLYTGEMKTFTIPRPQSTHRLCGSCKTQNPLEAVYCKNCGTKLRRPHDLKRQTLEEPDQQAHEPPQS